MPDARTTHPTPQQLAEYSLGKLPAPVLSAIHHHLATCEDCRRQVENQPSDSFMGQLRAAIPRGGTLPPRGSPQPPAPAVTPSKTVLPSPRPATAKVVDDLPPELASSSKFQILGKLGQGGMGAVYKAKHNFLGELVAIKVMTAQAVGNSEARSRFLREMRAVGQLKHRNIVRALDAEQIGDTLVLVMEYVPGITLDRLVSQRGPLPVDLACWCIAQAALGLQHAHERGMVHRDVKPANVIVAPKEKEVKLLDFGLVRGPRDQVPKGNQTQLQTFMGTPEYVAPEQATDARSADIRADIYSLGCTLYFLLAGRPPFEGATPTDTIVAQVHDEPQPLTAVRTDLPGGLWAVVARMLAKQPAHRFQTPLEVARSLEPFTSRAARSKPEPAEPASGAASQEPPGPIIRKSGLAKSRNQKDTRMLLAGLTTLLVLTVAGVVSLFIWGRRPTTSIIGIEDDTSVQTTPSTPKAKEEAKKDRAVNPSLPPKRVTRSPKILPEILPLPEVEPPLAPPTTVLLKRRDRATEEQLRRDLAGVPEVGLGLSARAVFDAYKGHDPP